MSEIDYVARVARGVALMDQKWPDWATEIDLEKLDIENGSHCMTAQYAQRGGGAALWGYGRRLLGLSMEAYEDHGFKADDADEDTAYPTLNALWRSEIERRRAAAQDAPAEPEAGA